MPKLHHPVTEAFFEAVTDEQADALAASGWERVDDDTEEGSAGDADDSDETDASEQDHSDNDTDPGAKKKATRRKPSHTDDATASQTQES